MMRMKNPSLARKPSVRTGLRPTNVSLDAALVAEAKALGVNISQASARGLEQAVAGARRQRWLEENKPALDAYNGYLDEHGLPLAKYRTF
jgi:antitoxin CcdA